jgi:hypothetical protein
MKKDITELYCFIDDFCKSLDKYLSKTKLLMNNNKSKSRIREANMSISEILTIELLYHQSPCKNFKFFYFGYLRPFYKEEFPNLVSYNRFIELKQRVLKYLIFLVEWFCFESEKTGISYIDSSQVAICHVKRAKRNKVFKGITEIGMSSKGWFNGFKLHLIINEIGQIQGVKLTKGNVDDRTPVMSMVKHVKGLLFGDKGYIKQNLFENLYNKGIKLVTSIKKNMKNKLFDPIEKILLKKRSIIETVFDILKNTFDIEHSRHRSPINAVVHIFSTIVAYCLKPSKPSIKYSFLIPN